MLKQSEESLRKAGVETRNADGTLKEQQALLESALSAWKEYKAGTDANTAAQYLFGRGASEMAPLLKMTGETAQRAKKDMAELNPKNPDLL